MSGDATNLMDSGSLAKLPSVAEVDGWEVESSSLNQPTNEELADSLKNDPVPERDADEQNDSAPVAADADDALSDDDVEKPAEKAKDEAKPKRKQTASERHAEMQARINAATRTLRETERQIEERKRQLTAPEPAKPTEAKADAPAGPKATAAGKLRPSWDEYEERGETFAKYQQDDGEWLEEYVSEKAEQRVTKSADARLADERRRNEQALENARHDDRLTAAIAKYPDFETVINENLSDADATPMTPFIKTVVERHTQGFDVLYHLGTHPAEAETLARLTAVRSEEEAYQVRPLLNAVWEAPDPARFLSYLAQNEEEALRIREMKDAPRQLMALGRLSERLSSPGANTGSPGSAPVSRAKPPIRPVGATRPADISSRATDEDESDLDGQGLVNAVRRSRERQFSRA